MILGHPVVVPEFVVIAEATVCFLVLLAVGSIDPCRRI